jgi:mannose-1-phosphate guanylyltransferase
MPKQYCCLLGSRSMLQHTLDRMNKLTPAARTLTVIGTHHGEFAAPQLVGRSEHVFRQPSSRDTGMALYVAIAMIKRWTPNAIITITPTDHYVAPAGRYVEQVRAARGVAARMRDKIVILGATPTEPDPELGYLSLGEGLTEIPHVKTVKGFVEKPSVPVAQELRANGALWNTMVTCGTVEALWELGRAADPRLIDILDSFVPLVGTADEDDAIEYIYRAYLPVSFSRDMLERAPERLAAMEMEGVEWSDWGRPERIETVLALRRSRALVPGHAIAP